MEVVGVVLERKDAPRVLPRPGLGVAVVGGNLALLGAIPKLVGDVVPGLVRLGRAPVLGVVGPRAGRYVQSQVVEGEHAGQPVGRKPRPVGLAGVAQFARFVTTQHLVSQLERERALLSTLMEDVVRQALHEFHLR